VLLGCSSPACCRSSSKAHLNGFYMGTMPEQKFSTLKAGKSQAQFKTLLLDHLATLQRLVLKMNFCSSEGVLRPLLSLCSRQSCAWEIIYKCLIKEPCLPLSLLSAIGSARSEQLSALLQQHPPNCAPALQTPTAEEIADNCMDTCAGPAGIVLSSSPSFCMLI